MDTNARSLPPYQYLPPAGSDRLGALSEPLHIDVNPCIPPQNFDVAYRLIAPANVRHGRLGNDEAPLPITNLCGEVQTHLRRRPVSSPPKGDHVASGSQRSTLNPGPWEVCGNLFLTVAALANVPEFLEPKRSAPSSLLTTSWSPRLPAAARPHALRGCRNNHGGTSIHIYGIAIALDSLAVPDSLVTRSRT